MKKIIFYIAISKDGFIADNQGKVDWLPQPKDDAELALFGYKNLMDRIDTIIMGSRSYQQVLGFGDWAWPDKQTYVFSHQALKPILPCVSIINISASDFMRQLKDKNHDNGKDIWLLGGAKLGISFAKEALIDEVILTVIPKLLGDGISLGLSFDDFKLMQEKQLTDGITQKTYVKKH